MPKEGYEFFLTGAQINGQASVIRASYSNRVLVEYVFPVTEAVIVQRLDMSITEPKAGNTADTNAIINSLQAKYATVDSVNWLMNEPGDVHDMTSTETFEKGKRYSMVLSLSPKAGYAFANPITLTINGESNSISSYDGYHIEISKSFDVPFDEISNLDISCVPPVIGTTPDMSPVLDIDSLTYATITSVKWLVNDPGNYADVNSSDTFAKGSNYILLIDLEPKAGFCFTKDTPIKVNGELVSHSAPTGDGAIFIRVDYERLGMTKINALHFKGKWPKPGDDVSAVSDFTNEENITFTTSVSGWSDLEGNPIATEKFESGKTYLYQVYLVKTNDQYFDEELKVYANNLKMEDVSGSVINSFTTKSRVFEISYTCASHNATLVPAKDATCAKNGNKAYYTCSDCDDWFEDSEANLVITDKSEYIIPATGNHDFSESEYIQVTGNMHKQKCKYCDAYSTPEACSGGTATCTKKAICDVCKKEYGEIDAENYTPATPVKENLVPATCDTDGSYDSVVYCSECEKELSRETKPETKLGHALEKVEKVDATCTTAGCKEYWKCTKDGCGKIFADKDGKTPTTLLDLAIAAKGHTWNTEYTVDVEATTTKEGSKSIHCGICGAIKEGSTVTIPKKETSTGTPTASPSGTPGTTPTPSAKPSGTPSSTLKSQKITTAKIKAVKTKSLKKKSVTIKLKAKTDGKGKITYKVTGYPKKMKKFIKVSKKGVVTLKKKAKKGTYKVTITAAAIGNYKKTTKVIKIKVK